MLVVSSLLWSFKVEMLWCADRLVCKQSQRCAHNVNMGSPGNGVIVPLPRTITNSYINGYD
jgi:hypothetical protein